MTSLVRILRSHLQRPLLRAGARLTESGDTLVEVLVALVIIGLCVVALMGVLTTAVTSAAEYRSLATVDTVLKNFADAVKYDVELQPQTPGQSSFVPCASTYQVVSEYPTTATVNAGVTMFATDLVHVNQGRLSTWTMTLSQPGLVTPITVANVANGGPTITGNIAKNVTITFTLQSNVGTGYIPPGAYNVALSDGTGDNNIASATMLTVIPSLSAPSPASGPVGTSVSLSASGFLTSSPLTVTVGGTMATVAPGTVTDANGNAPVTFTNPLSSPTGPQTVVVSDGTYSAKSTFTVAAVAGGPGPTVTPRTSAVANSTVQISSIEYWDTSTAVFDPSCGPNDNSGIQMVILTATASNGVADTLQVVVTNPAFAGPVGVGMNITTKPSPPVPGQSITFTVTLTGGSGAAPTGTMGWNFTGTTGIPPQPCPTPTTVTPGSGNSSTASCLVLGSSIAAGTYQVAVSYSGDANYGPSSTLGSVTVPQQTLTFNVTHSPGSPIVPQSLTFTATATGPGGASQPAGTVTWTFSGGSPAGASCAPTPLTGSPPTAQCTINPTLPGTYGLTAAYSGDINYAPTTKTDSATAYVVSLTNVALINNGSTPGMAETGDTIVLTYSGAIPLGSLCSAWAGDTTNETLADGVVTLVDGGKSASDSVTMTSASCATPTGGSFGSIKLRSHNYVTNGNAVFTSSTIAWNATAFTLTITLGTLQTPSGTLGTASSSPIYTSGFSIPGSPFTIPSGPQF